MCRMCVAVNIHDVAVGYGDVMNESSNDPCFCTGSSKLSLDNFAFLVLEQRCAMYVLGVPCMHVCARQRCTGCDGDSGLVVVAVGVDRNCLLVPRWRVCGWHARQKK